MLFVLIDAWLLFFSKKVNFMADLHRKYSCRSVVSVLETPEIGINPKTLLKKIVTNSIFYNYY